MAESLSTHLHREVIVPTYTGVRWKEITVYSGASASLLQDIKVPESCGGYSYTDSGIAGSPVSNRYIYWRVYNDVLELVEQSLDVSLTANHIRYRFQDTPILDGVSIHELHNSVVVLVATVASVHRLVFPHPEEICRHESAFSITSDSAALSVFHNASLSDKMYPQDKHMLNPSGNTSYSVLTAATYVTGDGDALFALGTSTGGVVLVRMPPAGLQGIVMQSELTQSTVMQKLWKGLVPVMIRGGQQSAETATSIDIQPLRGDFIVFCVCRDHKLRLWSVKTRECVLVFNLLDCLPDGDLSMPPLSSTSGHTIKKIQTSSFSCLRVCVHLNFPDRNQFCLLEPHFTDGRFQIARLVSVYGPSEDLVDFCISSGKLFTLWTSSSGETILRATPLSSDHSEGERWIDVLLQRREVAEILIPPFQDPSDVYLERIFHPGRFSSQDLLKALNVYRRSLDMPVHPDTVVSMAGLREEVVAAVESEIRNCVMDYEVQEEEYYQLQLEQWTKFYSCCIQYQEVGAKVKGLFANNTTGLVGLIKKDCMSYVRPCDQLEEMYLLSSGCLSPLNLDLLNISVEDYALSQDVKQICDCVCLIREAMTEELCAQFEANLIMMESPKSLAEKAAEFLFCNSNGESSECLDPYVIPRLQEVRRLLPALHVLLKMLDLQPEGREDEMMDDSVADATRQLQCSHLFTSSTASAVLAQVFEQISSTRLAFSRDLLILQCAILKLHDPCGIGPEVTNKIKSHLLSETSNLIQSYLLLVWTSQTVVVSNQTSTLDFNTRQLAALEISDGPGAIYPKQGVRYSTLAELFIEGVGGTQARSLLAQCDMMEREPKMVWSQVLVPLVGIIAKIVWPNSENFLFAEFLVKSCQYLHLQEYVRLLAGWCPFNAASRCFLLGLSYLHFDQPHQAAQCFMQATSGLGVDTFLTEKLLQAPDDHLQRLEVLYFLKVIKQFEEFLMPDMVIDLAHAAIGQAAADDPNLATLWSKVFKYNLELGHNEAAYAAMVGNPDMSRRRDCLRQLLIVLGDRGDLDAVVRFPYIGLEDEVVSILENRARSVDLATHNYYNLLYAFHVYRHRFRTAGSVMYEHGKRLGCELPGLKGLQRQAQCYLAALSALRLAKHEYAWIVKPVPPPKHKPLGYESPEHSLKHGLDGENKPEQPCGQKMEILELADIEREYMLVDARLRLARHDHDPAAMSGPTADADEMVGLLVNAGLFDRAVVLAQCFNLPLNTVFENLALRCVNLAKNSSYFMIGDNDYTAQAWDWLQKQQITDNVVSRDSSASDQAWAMLQKYLECYEDKTAKYHRCTGEKLLSHGFALPAWFVNRYKSLNAEELLRLYIDYDLLEEAHQLSVELIDAVSVSLQGQDSKLFSLKGCVHHIPQEAWIPYVSIDQLLAAIKDHQDDPTYNRMFQELTDKMADYHRLLERISNNICATHPVSQ
ncbi:nuclear pore complex protein Nup160-like [Gigantopelta aegis]|uniref:nuclear pore complex protein Nup160-like n=1 Tax=Gigantopelta aegis TaxID=1735272 RepID=UPI001B88D0CF|nr:nuclear pore complex protein Nup160-like [Gigantopelta aegis]